MLVRVTEPGKSPFQLRAAEEGISVFDTDAVNPPLTDSEILESFRPGGLTIVRAITEIEAKGLRVVAIPGAEPLPQRLREAHAEIRPGPGMTRAQFKQILKGLE